MIPGVLVTSGITRTAYCETCGDWKSVTRKLTPRETANLATGKPIDYRNPLPAEPMF